MGRFRCLPRTQRISANTVRQLDPRTGLIRDRCHDIEERERPLIRVVPAQEEVGDSRRIVLAYQRLALGASITLREHRFEARVVHRFEVI
jgi:hypothetical protein